MITEFDMYLITRATAIHDALSFIGAFCSFGFPIVGILLLMMGSEGESEEATKAGKIIVKLTPLAVAVLLLSMFVPTTKDLCAIKVVPAIVNNEAVGEIAAGTKELALEWMRDQVNSLKKEKK